MTEWARSDPVPLENSVEQGRADHTITSRTTTHTHTPHIHTNTVKHVAMTSAHGITPPAAAPQSHRQNHQRPSQKSKAVRRKSKAVRRKSKAAPHTPTTQTHTHTYTQTHTTQTHTTQTHPHTRGKDSGVALSGTRPLARPPANRTFHTETLTLTTLTTLTTGAPHRHHNPHHNPHQPTLAAIPSRTSPLSPRSQAAPCPAAHLPPRPSPNCSSENSLPSPTPTQPHTQATSLHIYTYSRHDPTTAPCPYFVVQSTPVVPASPARTASAPCPPPRHHHPAPRYPHHARHHHHVPQHGIITTSPSTA